MTPLARYALDVLMSLALPFLTQLADKRWILTAEQRSGAWNAASWGSAVYGFGPLSMIGWVWVTRLEWRRWRAHGGWGEVILWSALLLFAGVALSVLLLYALSAFDRLAALALGLKP